MNECCSSDHMLSIILQCKLVSDQGLYKPVGLYALERTNVCMCNRFTKHSVLHVFVAVTVAEHTSICTVYDFTIHPVSVHLPLTRLLASLYILIDEPVEVSIVRYLF